MKMSKKILTGAPTFFACSVLFTVAQADNTITSNGVVSDTTCTATIGGGVTAIDMGATPAADLKAYTLGVAKNFSFSLADCPTAEDGGNSIARATPGGVSDTVNSDYFKNQATDEPVTSVAVVLFDGVDKVMKNNEEGLGVDISSGVATIPLAVKMVRSGDTDLTKGTVQTTVTYNVTYYQFGVLLNGGRGTACYSPLIKRMRYPFFVVDFLLSSSIAQAGMVVGGTCLVFNGTKNNAVITVKNKDQSSNIVQSWFPVVDAVSPAKDVFIIMSSLLRLKVGEKGFVRVVRPGKELPDDRESMFWPNIKGIPATEYAPDKNAVQFVINSKTKLTYRPAALKGSTPESYVEKLQWGKEGASATVENDSSLHMNSS